METVSGLCEKIEGIGLGGPVFTLGTANSACSVVFYTRISGIRANPLKCTAPDGNLDLVNNISIPTPDDFIIGIGGGGFGGIANTGDIAIISGAVIGVAVTASQALKDDAISTSISDTTAQTKTKQDRVLYHNTNTPPSEWKGVLRPGSYLTPNGSCAGKQAANRLALPQDPNTGKTRILTHRITFNVKEGEYTSAPNSLLFNLVKPANGKLGLGREFINTVPLVPTNYVQIPAE
ncbi:MAG: hypothetical protein LBL70_02400 [Treponema sp.]|jgi:hypothetical protein|nr:hypothetical protein [Treponema sp.]